MSPCPQCMDTGRIRIIMRAGEYTHQREEYCPCPVGQRLLAESKEDTDLEPTPESSELGGTHC